MSGILELAAGNLLSPIILSFALGLFAALARSDLVVPEAMAKALSIYLLFAIGFKGGVGVAAHGLEPTLVAALIAGIVLSAALPLLAYALVRTLGSLDRLNAAAVAGHYGSISIVTFVAATSVLQRQGISAEGYMVAVAAAMEAPAILTALWLASRFAGQAGAAGAGAGPAPATARPGATAGATAGEDPHALQSGLWREILLNGSIVLLIGAFAIGLITGEPGLAEIESFIVTPFKGVLCLFLLDMGLLAGRGLRASRGVITPGLLAFGIVMPVLGASFGLLAGLVVGLSTGGVLLLMVLSASASYIAVPAAMRVALPEADPGIYLTLSLGITFPFNLTLGIPLYLAVASAITG